MRQLAAGARTLAAADWLSQVEREAILRFKHGFAHLQKFREQADYGPVLALTAEDVARDLEAAREFAGEVRRILGTPERAG